MATKLPDAETLLPKLAAELKARVTPATAMIGLYTGGAWLAERLHPLLGLKPRQPTQIHRKVARVKSDFRARMTGDFVTHSSISRIATKREYCLEYCSLSSLFSPKG